MTFLKDKLVPLAQLADAFGYSRDHLAFLCRSRTIAATRSGRSWLTTFEEVKQHQKKIEKVQSERWEEMSERQRLTKASPVGVLLTWDEVIAGGLDIALQSFAVTFRMIKTVFGSPLILLFFLTNKALFFIYAAFNYPISSVAEIKGEIRRYLDLLFEPVPSLYLKHRGQHSLCHLMKAAVFTQKVSVTAFVVFTGGSLLWFVRDLQTLALSLTPAGFFAIMFIQKSAKGLKQKQNMPSNKKQTKPITVWRALNEPVVEVTEEAAKTIFTVAAVLLLFAWLSPYFGQNIVAPQVAGASTMIIEEEAELPQVLVSPEWYFTVQAVPDALGESFAQAAYQVLDISEPVAQIYEFYQPGLQAVNNAWLELIQDPYPVYY